MIQRYNFEYYDDAPHDSGMEKDDEGEYVTYSDHLAALAEWEKRAAELAAEVLRQNDQLAALREEYLETGQRWQNSREKELREAFEWGMGNAINAQNGASEYKNADEAFAAFLASRKEKP